MSWSYGKIEFIDYIKALFLYQKFNKNEDINDIQENASFWLLGLGFDKKGELHTQQFLYNFKEIQECNHRED